MSKNSSEPLDESQFREASPGGSPAKSRSDTGMYLNNPYIDLNKLSEVDLRQLQLQIELLLPPNRLEDLDLRVEMVKQYRATSALQAETINSLDDPNKKATVLNSCSAALQNLVKMQTDLYNAERFKAIENRLIQALEVIPEQYLTEFFAWYETEMVDGREGDESDKKQ